MRYVNRPKNIFILLLFLFSFINTGFSLDQLANTSCYNSTHLLISDDDENPPHEHLQGCAYGCYIGECLDGTSLGVNGALILAIFWAVGFFLMVIAGNINSDEYGLIKSITYALGIFFVVAGIFALLGVYENSAGIGTQIKNMSVSLVQGLPYTLVGIFMLYLIYYVLLKFGDVYTKNAGVP